MRYKKIIGNKGDKIKNSLIRNVQEVKSEIKQIESKKLNCHRNSVRIEEERKGK